MAKYRKLQPFRGKRKALIDVLINPDNAELNVSQICELAKISRTIYYKYFAEKEFKQYVKDCTLDIYVQHLPQVANKVLSIAKSAKRGSDKAQKIIHDSVGFTGSNNTQTVNIANQAIPVEDIVVNTPEELALLLRDKIQELQAMLAQVTGMRIETAAGMITAGENATPCHTPPIEPAKAGE